jgi:hypothetical protein
MLLLVASAMCAAIGCEDISRFETKPGESYCGQVVPGGFVREGFAPGVQMRVHIYPDSLQEAPGDLTTDDDRFVDAKLRPIPQLAHDSLSFLRFGEGSVRNLLFGVSP